MLAWVGALKAGAAQHDVDVMGTHIVPNPLPEEFHHGSGAVGLENAGASEFEEAVVGVGGDERRDVKFSLRVETAMGLGNILPEQAIGPYQASVRKPYRVISIFFGRIAPDHHEMVADLIEAIDVHAPLGHVAQRFGSKLFVEDPVAKPLACGNFV